MANGFHCNHHVCAVMTPARALILCASALTLVRISAWWCCADDRPKNPTPPSEFLTGSWIPQSRDDADIPLCAAPAEMQIAKLISHIRADSSQGEVSLSDGRTLTLAVSNNQPGLLSLNVPLSKGWTQITLSVRTDGEPALLTDGTCSRRFIREP